MRRSERRGSIWGRLKWPVIGMSALLLAACDTAPPKPPPPPPRPAVITVPAPAPVASAAPAVPAASAASASAPARPAVLAPDGTPMPYAAVVAARFPDPPVAYRTPAFAAGRHTFTSNAEVYDLLRGLAREPAGNGAGTTARLLTIGHSQNGTPIFALLYARGPDVSPAGLRRAGKPTVLLVGQQHGDEPAGAEALLVVAQQLSGGPLAPLLEKINVIVLPRANPDGAQAGTRASTSGIDVNRDHLLLKTPEAQAQASIARDYRPAVVVDAHEYTVVGRYLEKFGTVQRFDALLQYAMTANEPEFVTRAAEEWFRLPAVAALKREGLTSEWYYTTTMDLADRKVSMGGTQPDTGRNVNGLRNAVSFLVETRGVGIGRLHLARRVHTHVVAITSILRSTAERGADLMKLRSYVDNEVSRKACQGEMAVEAGPTPSEYALQMIDPETGADRTVAVPWDSALELRVLRQRLRPCGYWLAADQADAVRKLRGLGAIVQRFEESGTLRGEAYRETARENGTRQDVRGALFDGADMLHVKVETVPTLLDVPAGSFYVPLDQPLGNLIVAALEPDTQNSYLASRIVSGVDRQARALARPDVKLSLLP